MPARLPGKVAIVTGAAGGIGGAIARRFLAEGAQVVLADVNDEAVRVLADELGPLAEATVCDVSAGEDIAEAVGVATDTFGGLDIVVNNAAIGSRSLLADMPQKEWERVLRVDLGGVFHSIHHAVPAMRERGGGAFVNISSVAGRRAAPGLSAYAAAKAAVEAVTRCAAAELREDGIRANAIAPGMIQTDAAESSSEALSRAMGTTLADYIAARQGRWGEAAEVAEVAVHLASEEARFTNGHTYVLDNGASAAL